MNANHKRLIEVLQEMRLFLAFRLDNVLTALVLMGG